MPLKNLGQHPTSEQEYFHRIDHELIEERRQTLDDEQRTRAAAEKTPAHWMGCPKCGVAMSEVDVLGLRVEKCPACEGVFFDAQEFAILVDSHHPKSRISRLRDILWRPINY